MTSQAEGNHCHRAPPFALWDGGGVLCSGFRTFIFPLQQRFRGDEDALMSWILIQTWIWIPYQKSGRFLWQPSRDKMNFLSLRHTQTSPRWSGDAALLIFSLPESVPILILIPSRRLGPSVLRRSRPAGGEK